MYNSPKIHEFDCDKCRRAKLMLENISELEDNQRDWAVERQAFTERYCPKGCDKPVKLRFQDHIDLQDSIESNGRPVMIDINPSFILKNKELNKWYDYCLYADNGLFPDAGGALDQDPNFLEYYKVFVGWKNLRKSS